MEKQQSLEGRGFATPCHVSNHLAGDPKYVLKVAAAVGEAQPGSIRRIDLRCVRWAFEIDLGLVSKSLNLTLVTFALDARFAKAHVRWRQLDPATALLAQQIPSVIRTESA